VQEDAPMQQEIVSYPLTVQGVRTRVLEAGDGERTVLFVHGLGARADRWRRTLGPLAARGWRCLALDLPGHGFADKGAGLPADVPALAEYVAGAARLLGSADTVLVGTSLGGHVLGRVALDAGLPVRGLMLIGTLGLFPLEPAVAAAIRASVVDTSLEAIRRKLAFVMKVQDGITPGFVREEFMINNSAGALESFRRLGECLVAQPESDLIGHRLAGLAARLPLSIVWGAEDAAVPVQIGADAHRRLGLPAPVLIEGAGHAPYWERPEVFDPLLGDFVARAFGAA
jgi:2-hydroxy-6-oxonona-2,4-dienedioate hydrolase